MLLDDVVSDEDCWSARDFFVVDSWSDAAFLFSLGGIFWNVYLLLLLFIGMSGVLIDFDSYGILQQLRLLFLLFLYYICN
mmetsp:Transcript_8548/g.12271  ORF Transcript_8548/g.12271 Transcript_8548/m.12271 type:complete len:80 (+) Transcript_8548:310-549(+)